MQFVQLKILCVKLNSIVAIRQFVALRRYLRQLLRDGINKIFVRLIGDLGRHYLKHAAIAMHKT